MATLHPPNNTQRDIQLVLASTGNSIIHAMVSTTETKKTNQPQEGAQGSHLRGNKEQMEQVGP
jgi:hypothetical protein